MKKIFKNMRTLILWFLVVPILLSFLIVINFNTFLEKAFIQNLILVSGYFFTFSSLLLVFALLNTFNASDHRRSTATDKFLESAPEQLVISLRAIKNNIKNTDVTQLYENCAVVTDIHDSLKISDAEVDLKAYTTEIKAVVNLINKHKLSSIGFESDINKLLAINTTDKHNIIVKIDRLLSQLQQRRYLNAD